MFINFIASCAAPVAFALSADEIKGPADVAMLLYLLHPFVYVVAYAATAYRKPRYWRHSGEYLFVMRDIFFVSLANTFLLFRGTFFAALLFSILFSGLSAYPLIAASVTYLTSRFVLLLILASYALRGSYFPES